VGISASQNASISVCQYSSFCSSILKKPLRFLSPVDVADPSPVTPASSSLQPPVDARLALGGQARRLCYVNAGAIAAGWHTARALVSPGQHVMHTLPPAASLSSVNNEQPIAPQHIANTGYCWPFAVRFLVREQVQKELETPISRASVLRPPSIGEAIIRTGRLPEPFKMRGGKATNPPQVTNASWARQHRCQGGNRRADILVCRFSGLSSPLPRRSCA